MRWLALVLFAACGTFPGGSGGDVSAHPDAPVTHGPPGVFDPAITGVTIEIDYEAGEAPFTGPILGAGDTFDLAATNLDRLFAGKKTLTLPRTLAMMEDIGTVADEELTVADVLALATAHRQQHDTTTTKTYYLIFVGGQFADGSGPNPNVLGVSIGDTGVVAMFKDVIRSTNVPATNVSRYVEQSTLIHELGHGAGLVDNGVAMVAEHKDAPHGAHCTDDHCVMYWLNEGARDAAEFVQKYVASTNTILFDSQCLADVDALTGGP